MHDERIDGDVGIGHHLKQEGSAQEEPEKDDSHAQEQLRGPEGEEGPQFAQSLRGEVEALDEEEEEDAEISQLEAHVFGSFEQGESVGAGGQAEEEVEQDGGYAEEGRERGDRHGGGEEDDEVVSDVVEGGLLHFGRDDDVGLGGGGHFAFDFVAYFVDDFGHDGFHGYWVGRRCVCGGGGQRGGRRRRRQRRSRAGQWRHIGMVDDNVVGVQIEITRDEGGKIVMKWRRRGRVDQVAEGYKQR